MVDKRKIVCYYITVTNQLTFYGKEKIMAKIMELCGLIHSKYESESSFSDVLGWSRQRLNKITNGKKEPDLEEVEQISEGLNEPFEKIAYIFLGKSHQTDNAKAG